MTPLHFELLCPFQILPRKCTRINTNRVWFWRTRINQSFSRSNCAALAGSFSVSEPDP